MHLQAWKDRINETVWRWYVKKEQVQAKSLYALLSASSLWPVFVAAQHGDQAAIGAFMTALGSVGASVLATRFYSWKEHLAAPEDDVTATLTEDLQAELEREPALAEAVEQLLAELNIVQMVQARLPDAALRTAFTEQFEAERKHWQQVVARDTAHIENSPGATIAQGGSTVVKADGGTAIQHLSVERGSVYLGTLGPSPAPEPEATADPVQAYCAFVSQDLYALGLRGLDVQASDAEHPSERMALANVYVALHTTDTVPQTKERSTAREDRMGEDRRPQRVLEAVAQHPRLVVLGDPGSGKSTFVRYLAYHLAQRHVSPATTPADVLTDWPDDVAYPVPLVITLRDVAQWLPDEARASAKLLWTYIVHHLGECDHTPVAERLKQRLHASEVLLCLDGLDEVPTQALRRKIRRTVDAFLIAHPTCRALITCRVLAYQQAKDQLTTVPRTVTLAPFTSKQTQAFITGWYTEQVRLKATSATEARKLEVALQQAVRRPGLRTFAANPLLLTVMALLHTHKGRLPEARAQLYKETIELLLWTWESVKDSEGQASQLQQLLQEVERDGFELVLKLAELAYDVHGTGGDDREARADISAAKLEYALAKLHPERSGTWAEQVMAIIRERSGLLQERDAGIYAFPHRTFQEYLAGMHLARQKDFAQQAAQKATEGTLWREVILLAVGYLVYNTHEIEKALTVVSELCPKATPRSTRAWRQVGLAGEALREIGVPRATDSNTGTDLLHHTQQRLVRLLEGSHLAARERAEAGQVLGALGDPRSTVTTLADLPFCYVPPGPFLYGKEGKAHELDQGYWISQFPISQAQYAAFGEAGGYTNRAYWHKRAWDEKAQRGWQHRASYGFPYDLPNHPVVGVSWYEAAAYAAWLTEQAHAQGWLPKQAQIQLPSEVQWEKAARGGLDVAPEPVIQPLRTFTSHPAPTPTLNPNPHPNRTYPWGDTIDDQHLNYAPTGVQATSALGAFPLGASPYGVQELSGNVWEWTQSLWRKNSESLVLRGGAFDSVDNVRCAARYYLDPPYRGYDLGFRVVLHHFSDL